MVEQDSYQMRGNRVTPLAFDEVKSRAMGFCDALKVNRKTVANMETFLENLSEYHICIDPIDDDSWLFFTDGHCDPSNWTIRIPESTYLAACSGDPDAVSTILHEIGHLMLAHQVVMHNEKSAAPTMEEDAEWQADTFADLVMTRMKLSRMKQLELTLL